MLKTEHRLDTAGHIVGQQADRAGRGNGRQVAVAQTAAAYALLNVLRQRLDERLLQQGIALEERKAALLLCQRHRCTIGGVAHGAHDRRGKLPCRIAAVVQTEHDERIRQPGDAETDAAAATGLLLLRRQRKTRQVDDIVEHAYRNPSGLGDAVQIDTRLCS